MTEIILVHGVDNNNWPRKSHQNKLPVVEGRAQRHHCTRSKLDSIEYNTFPDDSQCNAY